MMAKISSKGRLYAATSYRAYMRPGKPNRKGEKRNLRLGDRQLSSSLGAVCANRWVYPGLKVVAYRQVPRFDLGKPCAFDEIGAQGKVGIVEWEVWACWLVEYRLRFGDVEQQGSTEGAVQAGAGVHCALACYSQDRKTAFERGH